MGFSRLEKLGIGFGSLLVFSGIIGGIVYLITGENNEQKVYNLATGNLNNNLKRYTMSQPLMSMLPPPLPKICVTQQCDAIALDIKIKMNDSVKPCDDFFEYVCGNANSSEGFWTSTSNFDEIKIRHINNLMDVIENIKDTYQHQLFKMSFDLCLDTEERNKLGLSVIKKALEKVNLDVFPNILKGKTENHFDWLNIVLNIKHCFNIDLIFRMKVVKNVMSINNNILTVETPKLSGCMGLRENICKKLVINEDVIKYVVNKLANEEEFEIEENQLNDAVSRIRIVHKSIEYIQKSVQNTVCDLEIVEKLPILPNVTEEFLLRKKLMKRQGIFLRENICKKLVINEDVIKYVVNKLANEEEFEIEENQLNDAVSRIRIVHKSIEYIQKSVQNTVCDLEIVEKLPILPNVTEEFLLRKKLMKRQGILLSAENKKYLKQIFDYIKGIDLKDLEVYIWWRFVFNWLMFTSSNVTESLVKKIEDEDFEFPSKNFQCAFLLYETLPGASRKMLKSYGQIVDEETETELIDDVLEMVNEIKNNLIANIKDSEILKEETKEFMNTKLEKTEIFLKSPDFPGFLQTFRILANGPHSDVTFFDVIMSAKSVEFPRNSEKINSVRDNTIEVVNILDVVTYFDSNAISIPLEFLKTPFYGLGLKSLDFGALGVLVAEAFVKLIDSKGIKFNELGYYTKVWNCGHKKDFPIFHINPLNLAYNSWDKFQGIEKNLLPQLYKDDKQLFFMSYSHLWCGSDNREYVMKIINRSTEFQSTFCL